MPRKFTPRPATIQAPEVTGQHIDNITIEAGLGLDGNIQLDRVFLRFQVLEVRDNGTAAVSSKHQFRLDEWPASIRTAARALRDEIFALADAGGLLDAGTDEGEIPPS